MHWFTGSITLLQYKYPVSAKTDLYRIILTVTNSDVTDLDENAHVSDLDKNAQIGQRSHPQMVADPHEIYHKI